MLPLIASFTAPSVGPQGSFISAVADIEFNFERCQTERSSPSTPVARPVSVAVETFGTETVPIEQIERAITETFDLRPAGIIKALDLRRPIFEQTAAYGHFGRTDLDNQGLRTFKTGWGALESDLAYTTFGPVAFSGEHGHRALSAAIRHSPQWVCRVIGESLYRYAA